jgi:hypothetical protein
MTSPPPAEESKDALGLTGLVVNPLERVPVRRRESGVTTSAWRMDVTCQQGRGGIVFVDGPEPGPYFRGEGIFLGWPQDRLAEAYKTLSKFIAQSDSSFELLQLG